MCLTIDQLDRACGILLLSESNAFVYCCKLCPNKFTTGAELETHILFEHYSDDDDAKPLERVFVKDDMYGLNQVVDVGPSEHQSGSNIAKINESHIQADVNKFPSNIIEPDTIKAASTRTSERIRTELSRKTKIQQKVVSTTKNNGRISTHEAPTIKLSEFVAIDDISVKIEQNQNQSLNTNDRQRIPDEMQSEATFIEEPFQTDSSIDTDYDDTIEVHVDDSNDLKQSASPKKPPSKKKTSHWKPRKGIFYCDMCPDVTFSSLESLKAHMKRHTANKLLKTCPLCPIRPRNMEKHMRIAHTEAKPYKCDYCDAKFRHNIGRVNHMRSHTGERPFLCAMCGKSFKSNDTRSKHNMRMHSEHLPHPCKECDRRFIVPSQLQEHIYSFHSTERPYACEICGQSYSTRKYLRKHRQSHGEKIHQCRHCEKKFKTTETRRWHERTVHKTL